MDSARRVLIVEDEIGLRRSLARYLEDRGLEVTQAGCISEAEGLLDQIAFDAVVLDVGLPDGDGLTLLARLPAERSLVISVEADPERLERCGVLHFLAKPLDLRVFASEVRALGGA